MAESKEQMWAELRDTPRAFAHGLAGGLIGPVVALGGAV